jgi:hypothetical protein
VKKDSEITSIEVAEDSNIADEEVIYKALGHSVFAILKENNLILEGWKDKRLFQVSLANASGDLKKKYKNVGVCHSKGTKGVKVFTPMIELAGRKCLIVSDNDKHAKEMQKIHKQEKGFGDWKTYQDVDPEIEAVTGEDFVKNYFITKQVKKVLVEENMPAFMETVLPIKKGKLAAIEKWLKITTNRHNTSSSSTNPW